jgi:uncharacterized protein YjbI with pentapeptide repeats
MYNPEHLAKLKEGVGSWNQWREEHPEIRPDLSAADIGQIDLQKANLKQTDLSLADLGKANLESANLLSATLFQTNLRQANLMLATLFNADLSMAMMGGAKLVAADLHYSILYQTELLEANLYGADLSEANLEEARADGANFRQATLRRARLKGANLHRADLRKADFREAILTDASLADANLFRSDLTKADLRGANLSKAYFAEAKLCEADFSRANLEHAQLIKSDMARTTLTGCRVYGISTWDISLDGATQSNLIITPFSQPVIQVDNLEVAQFIYLLLNNQKIREVIDTITSKVVLILGRFTDERKPLLEAIRDELRKLDYLPVLFDFEKPSSRDITETVSTLAHMARFVIADITDAKSIPQELERIVPNLPSVPIQPLLLASQQEYGMFEHLRRYPWVLETIFYEDQRTLLEELKEKVICPAESKARSTKQGSD